MTAPAAPSVVLVTGAGGFIGGATMKALALAGFVARGGARRAARGTPACVACDLDNPAEVRAAVAGADLVVHAAYGEARAMEAQTGALLEAMAREGVASLVALSSIAVYGARTGRSDEDAPLSALDDYGRGKIAMENAVAAWAGGAADPPRRAIALRPGCVYGSGSLFWIDKLAQRIRLGAWGDFGPQGEGPAPLIHVEDLAALIVAAARRLIVTGRHDLPPMIALNAVGPQTPTWNTYFRALAARIGAPPLPNVDTRVLASRQAMARPAKLWRRLGLPGGRAAASAPTSGEIALFSRQALYPADRATVLLGYSPRIGVSEGLSRTEIPSHAKT